MQTAFSVAALLFAIFIFAANPKEKVNQWCSIATIFFFLGIFKQAVMFEIIPLIQNTFGAYGLAESFAPLHNIFTWVIYTLGMPTMTIGGCYFGYIDFDRKFRIFKYIIYIPGMFLMLFFSPLKFIGYQPVNKPFWITYTAYNFAFGAIIAIVTARGIRIDRKALDEGSILKKKQNQRKREAMILLPTLYFWLFSVFPVNLLNVLGLDAFGKLLQMWQLNLVIMLLCIFGIIFSAVKGDGFLGIKIIPTRYSHNLKMPIDDFMSNLTHRIKSDTSYMSVKTEKIRDMVKSGRIDGVCGEINENIEELSGKIQALNNLARKFNRYSNTIDLENQSAGLKDLLNEAKRHEAKIYIEIVEDVRLECDKSLMVEVFKDIIDNGVQAIQAKNAPAETEKGKIVISGAYEKNKYKISFKDNGTGIPPGKLENIFDPGVTTKNKEFNSGLGLANCKKVIAKHGGNIYAENNGEEGGATIIIELPSKIAEASGKNAKASQPVDMAR